MNDNSFQLKLVIINNPYAVWDHPLVPTLFSAMVKMKKSGYGSMYSKNIMPVDTTDFIATHILLCMTDRTHNLKPIMGYKSTTLHDCEDYNLSFPALSLVKNAGADLHAFAVQEHVKSCKAMALNLAYLASWTLDHKVKSQYSLKNELREIFMASYYFLYQQQDISQIIIGGTLRFRTDKIFAEMGHRPLMWDQKILEPIKVTHLAEEPVQVMMATHVPQSLRFIARRWEKLWNDRLVIGCNEFKILKAA